MLMMMIDAEKFRSCSRSLGLPLMDKVYEFSACGRGLLCCFVIAILEVKISLQTE